MHLFNTFTFLQLDQRDVQPLSSNVQPRNCPRHHRRAISTGQLDVDWVHVTHDDVHRLQYVAVSANAGYSCVESTDRFINWIAHNWNPLNPHRHYNTCTHGLEKMLNWSFALGPVFNSTF